MSVTVAPLPPSPPVVDGQYVVITNGQLTIGGQRWLPFGANIDASAIWSVDNPKAGVEVIDQNQEK